MRYPRPEARSRRTEKPQVERRVANVPRKGTSTPQGVGPLVAPHGAPFPRIGRGAKDDGPPRGLDKEYGRRSVGSGCLTIESENWRAGANSCCRPRESGDPYAVPYRDAAEYGSRVSLTLARDDGKNSPAMTVK